MSRKQKSVALSTMEAEYIAVSMACCEVVWLRKLFSELFAHVLDTTIILCDNQSGIWLSENPVFHDRSKHIDIKYPLIHQCKRELTSDFEMKDLGLMHYFLGLEVWQRPGEIFLS